MIKSCDNHDGDNDTGDIDGAARFEPFLTAGPCSKHFHLMPILLLRPET